MTRGQALGGGIVILAVAWVHSLVSGIIVTIAIIGICWVTVRVHPRVRHTGLGSCHGTGEYRNMFFPWRFHRCKRCNGGRLISPLAGHFGAGHIQGEYARTKQARELAKENRRWR
ncbi:MAG: hypothetical protein WAL41_11870 [Mycobacterium sp.]